MGTHLCGALSPRLLELFGRAANVHSLVLSPCCLKGFLGKAAQRQAEQELGGAEPTRRAAALAGGFQATSYRVLVEGLRERLRAAGGAAIEVDEAAYDEQVLSPVNGFITAHRRTPAGGGLRGGLPGAHEVRDDSDDDGGEGAREARAAVFELGGVQALGWRESGLF